MILFISLLFLGGCSLAPQRSGVEIMSSPQAKVYLDGKSAGMTPYKNNELKPGDMDVKLVSPDGKNSWQKTIRLENYSDTVVDIKLDDQTSGYVLNLEKTGVDKSGLLVSADPNQAAVAIDGEIKGFSPLKIEDVGEGDKQITISYPGYKSNTIYAKGINGYQLLIDATLAPEVVPIATESPVPTPGGTSGQTVKILDTGVGWLRVRDTASVNGKEVGRVTPGQHYPLLEIGTDWDKIQVNTTISGWVSTKYVSKDE